MEIEFTQLEKLLAEIFAAHGVAPPEARLLSKELTDATFAGYESHGIGRVKSYDQALKRGALRPGARLETILETPVLALLDAGQGFGIRMALEAARVASDKARVSGIGVVSVRNCGDVARLAPYAEKIAREGFIGIVMANDAGSGLVVAPHGGIQPRLCTNPIAAGIPRPAGAPLVFDFATSQVALGAVRAAARRKSPLPPDVLIGSAGEPVTEAEPLFAGLAALLPLGGRAFGFKGTALALLTDVLAGGLSGDGLSGEFPDRHGRNAIFMLAIDPGAFGDRNRFEHRVETFLTRVRSSLPIQKGTPVRLPGERTTHPAPGVMTSVPDALWSELRALVDP